MGVGYRQLNLIWCCSIGGVCGYASYLGAGRGVGGIL